MEIQSLREQIMLLVLGVNIIEGGFQAYKSHTLTVSFVLQPMLF